MLVSRHQRFHRRDELRTCAQQGQAEPDPGRAPLWRRLACALMTLAPHAVKFVGKQTVQYYVADGKYRKQVFAMEDLQDGNLTVYCPDVLDEVIKAGVIAPAPHAEPHLYEIKSAKAPLRVELLDKNAMNPGAHFKDMLGWNRKALRITVPRTRRAFIYPARHFASDSPDPSLPAMGQRFRMKANYPIGGFPRQARVVLKALKRYGMIVADNGSDWYITGSPHRRWNNTALHRLGEIEGRHFEVVDTSRLPRP